MHCKRLMAVLAGSALTMLGATPDPKALARGRQLFQEACGFCHGEDATGARGPDLIRSSLVNHDQNGNLIGPVIRNGREEKGMPAFPYSSDQISDISTFLHEQVEVALRSNRVPRDYPIEKLLTGDATQGKAYFFGAGHCDSCHSPTGDLAGIAKKYSPIDLEARFLYPAGRAPRTATVTPPSGEKVTGTVLHLDEFTIAVRDSSGWYHSWPRSKVQLEVRDPLAKHRELLSQYTDADVHNLFAYLETLK